MWRPITPRSLGTALQLTPAPGIYQLYEIRLLPGHRLDFSSAVRWWTFFLRKADPLPPAKILFALRMGFFGFSMFRLVLFQVYRDNLT